MVDRKSSRTKKTPSSASPEQSSGPVERAVHAREAKSWLALRSRLDLYASGGGAPGKARAERRSDDKTVDDDGAEPPSYGEVPSAFRVAAMVMLARAIDATKGLAASFRTGAPIVAFDIDDSFTFDAVVSVWKEVIFGDDHSKQETVSLWEPGLARLARSARAIHAIVKEAPKAAQKTLRQRAALLALAAARPVVAFTPFGEGHLPDVLLRADCVRVSIGPPGAVVIRRTIAVVTGEAPKDLLEQHLAEKVGLVEIGIAVRHDRSAAECMARLRALVSRSIERADRRDLTLDELHGMDEVVAYGRAFVRDVESYRRGAPFSSIDAGLVLDGPSGTGKTTAILAISRAARCELVSCSYARWQSSGDGHLGHFLRAMAADFALARKKAEANGIAMLFVDEIDSFGRRDSAKHEYSVAATNGFLFYSAGLLGSDDGSVGAGSYAKPSVILAGACNDVARCDPAVIRAGRFNRVIKVGLPGPAALEKIMRLRLRGDLADADLTDLALMAAGHTGADIERVVNDARRLARHEAKPFALAHLQRVFADGNEPSPTRRLRIAVHEGSHILIDVLLNGPEGAYTTLTTVGQRLAGAFRLHVEDLPGTFEEHFRQLQVHLAGRVGETEVFHSPGDGQGGMIGSDLHQATSLACAMTASFGLRGPPLFLGPADNTRELLAYPEVRTAVAKLLEQAEEACTRLIVRHRAALDEIAAVLLADGRIDGAAVAAIVARRSPHISRAVPDGSGFPATDPRKDRR